MAWWGAPEGGQRQRKERAASGRGRGTVGGERKSGARNPLRSRYAPTPWLDAPAPTPVAGVLSVRWDPRSSAVPQASSVFPNPVPECTRFPPRQARHAEAGVMSN